MRVKDLRKAIEGVDDEMVVLLRVDSEDGEQFICSPSSAEPDPGCTDVEMFVIDGTNGECEHGVQSSKCNEQHADE